MHTIQNEVLLVTIKEAGAELDSIYHKQNRLDYLWGGDPAFWAKKSPVLFPIVGALKNNHYIFKGKTFSLARHGFARERVFTVCNQSEDAISFLLKSDAETLEVFPFVFELI
ncbi:MAG: aldose 1-epimerase family protein, partial [Chitinophagaceae bacterium]